ncbi:DUF1003 domain-containing protein [Mucilaginibacter lappiensis]|uniref:Membrane protein n=1 Tax=Mucilaginibacter lappiensis TaxID=354630 RepID=A0A1N6PGY5_9SPHI|nr:DUF1003 domain-containing protein [Mucilaginibacter lappiensis]MBB6107586.1 putative membrane protein [Mucilaginibacter lappiensis]MBB6126094.1 putative membrane protein [Mucilaginibacter lappiensis]SIQ03590.1 Uncharacterized membrane protein [Mucilaginibacter lappiensis]
MANEPINADSGDLQLQSSLNFTKTRTDKLAVFIINALGSMIFLMVCILIFGIWICWNVKLIPGLKPFDPFPFSTLEMAVSIFAIILSISVLINQNRQGRIEKIRQQVEFEVNVRAESEITKVLHMLHEIHQKLGLNSIEDLDLEKMKEQTDINKIHQSIDEKQNNADSTTSNNQ